MFAYSTADRSRLVHYSLHIVYNQSGVFYFPWHSHQEERVYDFLESYPISGKVKVVNVLPRNTNGSRDPKTIWSKVRHASIPARWMVYMWIKYFHNDMRVWHLPLEKH